MADAPDPLLTNHDGSPVRRVLAVMAHPDDAEILCAGTLIRLAELGWEIHIATAASGDCGTMTETRWALAGRRTGEEAPGLPAVRLGEGRSGGLFPVINDPPWRSSGRPGRGSGSRRACP